MYICIHAYSKKNGKWRWARRKWWWARGTYPYNLIHSLSSLLSFPILHSFPIYPAHVMDRGTLPCLLEATKRSGERQTHGVWSI